MWIPLDLTYMMSSHGGLSRIWQNTWHSLDRGSLWQNSSCIWHIRQKWTMRCRRTFWWWSGSFKTISLSDILHDSSSGSSATENQWQRITELNRWLQRKQNQLFNPPTSFIHLMFWNDKELRSSCLGWQNNALVCLSHCLALCRSYLKTYFLYHKLLP